MKLRSLKQPEQLVITLVEFMADPMKYSKLSSETKTRIVVKDDEQATRIILRCV